jgi:hypothetical protein
MVCEGSVFIVGPEHFPELDLHHWGEPYRVGPVIAFSHKSQGGTASDVLFQLEGDQGAGNVGTHQQFLVTAVVLPRFARLKLLYVLSANGSSINTASFMANRPEVGFWQRSTLHTVAQEAPLAGCSHARGKGQGASPRGM